MDYKEREYFQIQESCYRLGVPVDIYYKLLVYVREHPENEETEMSRLEKEINDSCWD